MAILTSSDGYIATSFWKSVALHFVCRKTYLVKSGGRKFKGPGQLNQGTRLYLQSMRTTVAQVQIINNPKSLTRNMYLIILCCRHNFYLWKTEERLLVLDRDDSRHCRKQASNKVG